LIPDFLHRLFADHAKLWAHSLPGVLRYVLNNSLPFATALVAAAICHRLISRRPESGPKQALGPVL
jgi:hypothetical protein